ncbi:MAG: glycosyltransferase [Candidatus Sulfopaludibacter sp.]|nr:glycosyltransferase [Candidatus Sulfopaludibacter sp.]
MTSPGPVEKRLAELEQRVKQLEYCQRTADAHIAALENSIIFRILRRAGRPLLDAKTRAGRWLKQSPFRKWYSWFVPSDQSSYLSWMKHEAAEALPPLAATPTFSILMSVREPRREWLEEAIGSVRNQPYRHWNLCICRDAASEPWVTEYLAGLAGSDERIRTVGGPWDAGISTALNRAAALAGGDYLLVLGDCDRLAANVLHWLAAVQPAEILYGDEDRLDDQGCRVEPIFKPGWSPDLLLSCMYFGRTMTVARSAWEQAGGLRPEYDQAHDYDLALRITDRPVTVRHLPRVLYHGREGQGSAAGLPGSLASAAAGRRALEDALRRRGVTGQVEDGPRPNALRVRWKPCGLTLASLIICSRSPRLLNRCLHSVAARTAYPNREIIVIQHLGPHDAAMERVIDSHGATRIPYSGPFHFSRMNNLAAQAARGSVLVFLNDDTEPLDESWLGRLVGQVERAEIGTVGVRLLYPSGTVQHAGIAVGVGDGCGHIGRGAFSARYWPWLELTRDVSAVTGACLAIRTALFNELGGFADEFPTNYNDTDLCLRVRKAGYRVMFDSSVVLRHYEGKTRHSTVTLRDRENWYSRWSGLIDAGDPFYSPHLTREREDLSLRVG